MGRAKATGTTTTTSRQQLNTDNWVRTARLAIGKIDLNCYEVGGSVRDAWGGIEPDDLDISVVGYPLEEVLEKLSQEGSATELVVEGKTIGVRLYAPWTPEDGIEFALARTENSTGEAHTDFDIVTHPDITLEEDLARRDFTCNALARKILEDGSLGEHVDPYNGRADINNKVLRQVGPTTIAEDNVRVLRGFVRVAKDNLSIDPETLASMIKQAPKLGPETTLVKPERLLKETNKIITAPYAAHSLTLMRDAGIFATVYPELAPMVNFNQESKYHDMNVDDHCIRALQAATEMNASDEVRWAALLHDSGKPGVAFRGEDGLLHYYRQDKNDPNSLSHEELGENISRELLERLKAPNHLKDKVTLLVGEHMFGEASDMEQRSDVKNKIRARRFIHRIGRDNVEDLLALRQCDSAGRETAPNKKKRKNRVFEELVKTQIKHPMNTKELNINGHDLMGVGIKGKAIGEVQKELLARIITEPKHNNKDRLLSWAEKLGKKYANQDIKQEANSK